MARGRADEEDEERYDPSRFPRYEDYLTWTIDAATTPNGVFGAKVMWGYFNGFVTGLRWAIPGRQRLAVGQLVPSVFPNLHYVWMTRQDKVAQAVSLWRAHPVLELVEQPERRREHGRQPPLQLQRHPSPAAPTSSSTTANGVSTSSSAA